MPVKPRKNGATNTTTPMTISEYSANCIDGAERDHKPAITRSRPPTYAVQATAAVPVAPKMKGVMNNSTPSTTVAQSCLLFHLSVMISSFFQYTRLTSVYATGIFVGS